MRLAYNISMRIISVFLLIFLFSFELPAFTSINEKMGIRVLEKLDSDIYLFKRGIQDGLKLNHHIRFKDNEGFISRGIVLALDQVKFMAIVYHVYRPKALNKKSELTISWLHQKFIPGKQKITSVNKDFIKSEPYTFGSSLTEIFETHF